MAKRRFINRVALSFRNRPSLTDACILDSTSRSTTVVDM